MNENYVQSLLEIPWIKEERNKIIKFSLLFEEIGEDNIPLFMNFIFKHLSKEEKAKLFYDLETTLYTQKDKIVSESDLFIQNKKEIPKMVSYREELKKNVRSIFRKRHWRR